MKLFKVQYKHIQNGPCIYNLKAANAADAIALAARDFRLTPADIGDWHNETAEYSGILEAFEMPPIPAPPAEPLKKTQKLNFHCDSGHGWLEVPRADVIALGIADKISPWSYIGGHSVYLEEDCDAGLYLDAAKAAGYTLNITEKYTAGDSPIRHFDRFTNKVSA